MSGPLVSGKTKKNTTADGYDGYETAATYLCVRLVNQTNAPTDGWTRAGGRTTRCGGGGDDDDDTPRATICECVCVCASLSLVSMRACVGTRGAP